MTNPCIRESDPEQRSLIVGTIALVVAILAVAATVNAFSEITNFARFGESLSPWKPFVWEFSSAILIGALIPLVLRLNRRFPVVTRRWQMTVPIHLLATLPFSILHVLGMVGLRKLVYAVAGSSYQFGPVLSGWVYEYRKDFVTYWMIIAYVSAFGAWRYWRKVKSAGAVKVAETSDVPSSGHGRLDRLVVRKLNREFIVDAADIARIESDGNYVTLHANTTTYQIRGSLSGLLKRLDGRRFVQIHRTQVINIDHVREIQPWDHGDYRVLLEDGSFINFSRRYRARLDQLFDPPIEGPGERAARP